MSDGTARWARRLVGLAATLAMAGALSTSGCASLGASPSGESLARLGSSPEWRDGHFENAQPVWTDTRRMLLRRFETTPGQVPDMPVPALHSDGRQLATPPASGLRVTWFGHSSSLIEIDGLNVLVDPLWSERISPVGWLGPKRWYPPPIALKDLPRVDVVVISHDHYDHLDHDTIVAMKDGKSVFVVPLGIGAHLQRWGIPPGRIVELDWWQSAPFGKVRIVATPGRHASGRLWPFSDRTLWCGFAIIGPRHRAYDSGDTGMTPAFDDIGTRLGPFDVALIEAGQYDADWPDLHLGPEQAVEAARRVQASVLIPVHWGLIALAHHSWTEPVERVVIAARCSRTPLMTPRPGESVEPALRPLPLTPAWWPETAWRRAADSPVVATVDGDPTQRVASSRCDSREMSVAAPLIRPLRD